jgi:hypothetical protein
MRVAHVRPGPAACRAVTACAVACVLAAGAAPRASSAGESATLCPGDEPVRFACTMARSGKRVSICEGAQGLVYRFGTPGRIELRLPDPKAPAAPYLFHERLGSAETKGVAFPRGAYAYVVTHFVGGRPVIEELAISVQRDGQPSALLKCAARPTPVGDLPALFERLREQGLRVVGPDGR